MVRFIDKPFVTDKTAAKLSSLKWKMACGIGIVGINFITISENKNDLFDIYPSAVFKQKSMRRRDMVILGIAHSSESAAGLVEQMICRCMSDRGNTSDIRGYFEEYIKDHL